VREVNSHTSPDPDGATVTALEGATTLDTLRSGSACTVVKIDGPKSRQNAMLKQRLLEMGLTAGAAVRVVRRAPFNGPIEISIRSYRLSIRRADARLVFVTLR
jgi:ferrous iron transport protein A